MATLKSIKNKYLSASDGDVLGVTTNTENVAALSFKLATADSLSKFNMVDGFTDDYNDATGVDSSSSTDATRNSNNYYAGSASSAGSTGFTVTGSLQTFTVPTGVSSLDIKCFGAGFSNEGGFSTGTLATSAGTQYAVVVGHKASTVSNNWSGWGYGGGGRSWNYPSGGGLSGVFTGTASISFTSSTDQDRMIICAGGSGGRSGQGSSQGGDGGGLSGGEGQNQNGNQGGTGGTQVGVGGGAHGGDNGNVMRGGQSVGSGEEAGGGGGFYGGGGSGSGYGAGGGAAYIGTQNSLTAGATYSGASSQKTSDPDYPGTDVAKVLFKYNTALYEDMTLQSNAFTAQADPTTARIILDEWAYKGAQTLNTDIKAYVSRDNGTTFSQITLADQGDLTPTADGGIQGNTVLMMHCDGSNNGTTFTDVSSEGGNTAHTCTANGNAVTSTAQYKFGTASGYFDGTGDYVAITGNLTDFQFGTDDLTIDFWMRPGLLSSQQRIFGDLNSGGSATAWAFTFRGDDVLQFDNGSGNNLILATSALSINTWYHIAVTRSGNDWSMYLNGVRTQNATNSQTLNAIQAASLSIGRHGDYGAQYYNGYVDEIRIQKGIAVWTGGTSFTPPIRAYAVSRRLLSGSADISGQPAGSNIKYKITTHNQAESKQTRVYGTSMAWA